MPIGKKENVLLIEVNAIEMHEAVFCCVGDSPLIMNRFNAKAWHELLFPSKTKNRAERDQSMKHDPLGEFRGAVYRNRDPKMPTLIHVPVGSFHAAMASAALDLPGTTKARIERLTRVLDVQINLYGVPQIFCAMVRNSDISRTPDVRTRPIFPQWACKVRMKYAKSILTERTISNLFGAAGMIIGIGDWRGEKGGSFGSWRTVQEDDPEYKQILKHQGRVAQAAALERPTYFDQDTEELLLWFEAEVIRRERQLESDPPAKAKRGGKKKSAPNTAVYVEDKDGNLLSNGGG